ncbi:serine hydrolase [Streptomyces brevispora]|uniref:serine hydrolase n=1 Tax=Streptomyces brevispora TaxID=887462 RepID=UPI0035D7C10C
MEEASVAGESPDKSEQQKSSGTARSEHDPRLAVFHEPASPAESGGRAETATAVFSTQRSEPGVDGEPLSESDTNADAEADSVAGAGTGVGADDDVTSGPEAAEETPEGPQGSVEAPGAESGAAEAVGEPAEPAEGVEPAGAAGAAEEPGEPESAAAGPGDDAAEPAEPEEGDARLRAAVAAWVSTDGDEQDGEAGGGRAGDGTADDSRDDSEPEPVAEAAKQVEEPVKEPVEPVKGPAGRSDATAASEARVPRTREEPGTDSHPEPSEDSERKAEPKLEPKAEPKPEQKPDEKADAKVGKQADAKADAKADGESDEKAPVAEDAQADGDKRGIDQPTAVFKTPRLPRVDQPTTALKITPPPPPAGTKPKPGSEPESGRKSEPESPAERTSKFVPLRADDVRPDPAPRSPGAPAPASGPDRSAPASGPVWAAQLSPDASLSGAERTRQQPMPPRPPLDLLAELTNTPPPPETPVRTAVRRVKIWTPLVLLLLIAFAIVQLVRPLPDPTLTLSAKPTYTFEGAKPSLPWPDQGQGYMAATGLGKVGSFGEQKPVPIASVAKAMTAYLVLKDHPLKRGQKGPGIKIDAKAESDGQLFTEGESTLDTVKEGDVLSERDALAALMIPSANNIARLLARWDAGSEKAFVEKMNATADELGMKNTTYTDPSGLTASTVSTAEDLVKLGEKLVEFPALMDITKLPEWKDPSGKTWRNYNTLVPYNNALGIKTGSTTKAGGNLLFAAHKMVDGTDQLIVGAVLGQYDKNSIIDAVNAASKKVMLATLDLLEGAKIVKKGDVVGTVDDGLGGTTPVVATKDVKAVGWSGLTVKLELNDDGRAIPHSAAAGTHVGTLTVGEGASQVKVAVALQNDLTEPTAGEKLTRVG